MSYLNDRIKAFGFAFSGLWQAVKSEKHLQLHLVAAALVIIAGFYFSITKTEWLMVLGCVAFVISLELINSALEKLCDLYSKERNPKIKYIKDVLAAAVLVASVFAAIAGIFIFFPYIQVLFGN